MATLIAVYNSEGCVGRCDARCYNAKHPNCDCVCGGANHGAGYDQAVDNTRAWGEAMVEEYAKQNGLETYTSKAGLAIQPTLLDLVGAS